ncbi:MULTISPECIES: hypothetical protein [Bacillus]|uniref:hypothetical protein n=1 Tax=Bacillus TaxID=1386 RepID=UPI00039B2629|nr:MULTISPECIES: hypothetical protein [Bacillus]ETB71164.1 hypothetical protein A943_13195 [Bacillus sp. CPSM8]MCJ8222975.1 hypothetical protein [Bacillus paralicheniformis]MCU4667473.1 hypothetical protein [Bacillus paralicheniformis]MEC4200866.1 hypothetical protein [Bacillus sp. AAVF1]MED1220416.1 hypothetical protein [Bacillus paralicheniformis]
MKETPFYKSNWFTILMLIVFFPVGLILMWANKKWTVTARIVVSIVIVVLAIVGYSTRDNQTGNISASNESATKEREEKAEQKAESQEKHNKQEAKVEKPKKEQEQKSKEEAPKKKEAKKEKPTKEKVEDIISEEIDKSRILEVSTNSWYENGEKTNYEGTNITLQGQERLTNSSVRFEMLEDAKRISSKIFKVDKVGSVLIMFKYPMQDVKGNESNDVILKVSLTRENAKDINWENFNSENFSKVADTYYEHPALSK